MDTIFALASGAGKGGVSVIRISGFRAAQLLESLTRKSLPKPRYASLRDVYDFSSGEKIDTVLTLWFPAPHSFTGEDVAEFHCHGSPIIAQRIFKALRCFPDVRMAMAGEFSRRAFEHGKMDLVQIEGLADLIEARTVAQNRQALRLLEGEVSRYYDIWRESLVEILAQLEAYIDFPDEDLPKELADNLAHKIEVLSSQITRHLNDKRGKHIREGIVIAIVGAPNAGKSSLINVLAKRDVAIVSPQAGTTRDVLEVHLDIAGFMVTLCDTAGLRESADEIERMGIERALSRVEKADMILQVTDAAQHSPSLMSLPLTQAPILKILNKADLIQANLGEFVLEQHDVIISTHTQQGIEELLLLLEQRINQLAECDANTYSVARERYREALEQCAAALADFTNNQCKPIELRAESIRQAAYALGSITGRIQIEELMDKIFSSFCIGK